MKYLIILFVSFCQIAVGQLVTNCSSVLLSNVHNIEYVAYITDTTENSDSVSDWLFVKTGTNFPIINNGNILLHITNSIPDVQVWAESDGNVTKIERLESSRFSICNSDTNFNLNLQTSDDLTHWKDILVNYPVIKTPIVTNYSFFRVKN